MGNNLGDLLLTALPLVILIGLLWAVSTALRPRDTGVSEAERYQRELASRSAAHQASQIQAALAQRARIEASAQPSQNRSHTSRPALTSSPRIPPPGVSNPQYFPTASSTHSWHLSSKTLSAAAKRSKPSRYCGRQHTQIS